MKSCVNKDTVSLAIPHGDGGKSSMGGSAVIAQVDLTHGIAIYEHKTVQYAGIVYFKNAEDAKKAAKMLGADIRYLF